MNMEDAITANQISVAFCVMPSGQGFGGTERYTEDLTRALRSLGVECCFIEISPEDVNGSSRIAHKLARSRAQLAHIHVWSMGAAKTSVLAAYWVGIPSLLSYHVPSLTCPNGSMIRWDGKLCGGRVEAKRCAPCAVASHMSGGLRWTRGMISILGPSLPQTMIKNLPRRARLAVRLADTVVRVSDEMEGWLKKVTQFHVFNRHSLSVLQANGIMVDQITLLTHGIDFNPKWSVQKQHHVRVRFIYTGRAHRYKGMEVLCRAIRRIPQGLQAEFHFFGLTQLENKFLMDVERLSFSDPRVRVHPPYRAAQLPEILSHMDMMVVPSTWMETGPLVALEAMAAGIPIIGSNLPGINEIVNHGVNGLLFEPGNDEALAESITRVCQAPALLEKFRSKLPEVKSMRQHAEEIHELYDRLSYTDAVEGDAILKQSPGSMNI